ncbi:MAG TPA: ABC transporter ATP-binding protein [Planctomycetaceae bacterium]|nr:ABC transporter ATP-binding protein [Planctomycetaceae bacterium]
MIEIENVTKTYRRGAADVRALRGLSCRIPPGNVTFVVGPSGSGKSSLLYLLGALDQPTSGEIIVNGRRLSQLSRRQRDIYRREQVGFVFQNFNLLNNLNAVENVLVPFLPQGISAARRSEAVDLLQKVGLGDRLDHIPNQLSGGEQQRVAIARALLKRPALVLADEPTGELDSESGAEIYRRLRDLRDQHASTVVVVTHDRTHIQAADNVLTLRDGRLATT